MSLMTDWELLLTSRTTGPDFRMIGRKKFTKKLVIVIATEKIFPMYLWFPTLIPKLINS